MPTMGTLKFSFKGFERDVRREGFADFARLGFFREGNALLFDVRFAAIYVFMVMAAFASYKPRFCSGFGKMTNEECLMTKESTKCEGSNARY
jgi:hypothetical protein